MSVNAYLLSNTNWHIVNRIYRSQLESLNSSWLRSRTQVIHFLTWQSFSSYGKFNFHRNIYFILFIIERKYVDAIIPVINYVKMFSRKSSTPTEKLQSNPIEAVSVQVCSRWSESFNIVYLWRCYVCKINFWELLYQTHIWETGHLKTSFVTIY